MLTGVTGLLIIRAYPEPGSSAPLRAEIRLTTDVSAGIERTLTLVDRDAVADVVRTWLDSIIDGPAAGLARHARVTRRLSRRAQAPVGGTRTRRSPDP